MLRLSLSLLYAASALAQPALRLTDIQLIGSHNSYHLGLAPSEAALLLKANPRAAAALDYRHPAIDVQLDRGVRQFEFDIFADSKGGLFANPAAIVQVAKAGLPADPPFDPAGVMKKPGFKVIHVQDLDYRSSCQPFTHCLSLISTWSKAHPGHLPIFILVENKSDVPRPGYMTIPEKLTTASFDALDAEIRSIFSPAQLLTPDDVRGTYKTLEQAVLTSGWPSLATARGKVVFLLDQESVTPLYTAGRPSLEGRVLFTNGKPGTPDAAFLKLNNPLGDPTLIPNMVRKGYLVRTMTDPSPAKRDAALTSGAQLLSTDYPFDYRAPNSGYSVRFESGNARCNPVVQAPACNLAALQEK
ncbi:MAG: phosphatidylinositol-specific phospholipase C1-like protein [Acidobacteria bacterium]|nr:phosphatidylinositol-specific phospholipase C1-like protein [Acidobacteriota bacterium]